MTPEVRAMLPTLAAACASFNHHGRLDDSHALWLPPLGPPGPGTGRAPQVRDR